MNDEPNFVFSPKPWIPSEKIVGYMIDMKKKLMKSPATESQPHEFIVKTIIKIHATEYSASIKCGLNLRNARLPVTRPKRNSAKPPKESKVPAPRSVTLNCGLSKYGLLA